MATDGPFLHQQAWTATFDGYNIVDCAVRSRNIIYLVLRKVLPHDQASRLRDYDIPTRLVGLFLDETDPAEQWFHQGVDGFAQPRCGVSRKPTAQGIVAALNGSVFASGSGQRGMEQIVQAGRPTAIRKIRCIDGRAYAVGLGREVYRRDGVGRWTLLDAGLDPIPTEKMDEYAPEVGFWDIDGFSERDIYAVGGQGDVWHYDGKAWSSCDFLTNWPLFTVCCAPDNNVYLSGEGGRLYRGRQDSWQQIWDAELVIPYNDTLWFDGKLWLCSDYQLHQLINGRVQNAEHAGEQILTRGHMDVGDGVLVIASLDDVRLFDGHSWRVLVSVY